MLDHFVEITGQEIIKLFNDVGCPALVILKTDRAGEEVENGCGVDFELAPYAVIHENNFFKEANVTIFYGWTRENFDIMHFWEKSCKPSVEALCDELKERDGYEIIWRKKDELLPGRGQNI